MVDGKEYDTVECSLFVASLDSHPEYRALSYTWGSKTDLKNISLDSQPFKITSNLEHALWQLQSHSRVKIFWIDALCINQIDNLERSEQVRKMRTIYERAEQVIVWLGRRSSSSLLAFSLFGDLYENRHSPEYINNTLRDQGKIQSFKAVISLFRRDYWNRVWIIQELYSAKEITIMSGKYRISWDKVQAVQDILVSRHYINDLVQLSNEEPDLKGLAFYFQIRGPRYLRLEEAHSSNLPDLYDILSKFWNTNATDPRDKVYALVGLTTARDDSRLTIDYSASVRQVFIDVVKYILVSSRKLDIICSFPQGVNDYELPSWVPDWTFGQSKFGTPLVSLVVRRGEKAFNSHGGSIAQSDVRLGDQILIANGILLSHVQAVGQKGSFEERYDFKTGIPIILSWYKLWDLAKSFNQPRFEEFGTTLFWGALKFGKYSKCSTPVLMERILVAIAKLADKFCPEETVSPELVALKEKIHMEMWMAESWISRATQLIRGRRFFISTSELVGMCPSSAEPGDIICILLGCSVPVVLRPQDGHYRLLGEAYVYGYMYGKAMDELAEGKFELRSFEIH
jgi:hypothetical protein